MPRIALVLGLAVLAAGCRLGAEKMEDRTPRGCAECHTEITRQWASSAHAEAWNDPAFVADTQGHTKQSCLGCHSPQPLLEQPFSKSPAVRNESRECGVDCHACHAIGCDYAGPYRSRIGPHGTSQDRTRLPCSSFCGTCHEREHEEYTSLYVPAAGSGQNARHCADCHMPASISRLTQGHLLSLIHPRRVVRDHAMPAFTDEVVRGCVAADKPVVLRAESAPGAYRIRFALTNQGAGHAIPTGKFGHRELRVQVMLLDEAGAVLGSDESSRFAGRDRVLRPGEPSPFSLTVATTGPARPAALRLLVERVNKARSFRCTLLEAEWPFEVSPLSPLPEIR